MPKNIILQPISCDWGKKVVSPVLIFPYHLVLPFSVLGRTRIQPAFFAQNCIVI